jgi:alpha-tubulin suppressor-like RCC1 family protein
LKDCKVDLKEKVIDMICGYCHMLVLTEDKNLFGIPPSPALLLLVFISRPYSNPTGWGRSEYCELGPHSAATSSPMKLLLEFPTEIKKLSGGSCHGMVVTEDDKLWVWGYNG